MSEAKYIEILGGKIEEHIINFKLIRENLVSTILYDFTEVLKMRELLLSNLVGLKLTEFFLFEALYELHVYDNGSIVLYDFESIYEGILVILCRPDGVVLTCLL